MKKIVSENRWLISWRKDDVIYTCSKLDDKAFNYSAFNEICSESLSGIEQYHIALAIVTASNRSLIPDEWITFSRELLNSPDLDSDEKSIFCPIVSPRSKSAIVESWEKENGSYVTPNDCIALIKNEEGLIFELPSYKSGFFHPLCDVGTTISHYQKIAVVM